MCNPRFNTYSHLQRKLPGRGGRQRETLRVHRGHLLDALRKNHVPLAAMLRHDNIVGGPFLLTCGQRVPQIVLQFLETNP